MLRVTVSEIESGSEEVHELTQGGRNRFSRQLHKPDSKFSIFLVIEEIGDESCEVWSITTHEAIVRMHDPINKITVAQERPSAHFYPRDGFRLEAEFLE